MRMYLSLVALLMVTLIAHPSLANVTSASSVDFYEGSLEEGQKKANIEGKLFFVDFYAKWCAPCKWMDETTFIDPEVTEMLNTHYVPLKVDIDEFDGFNLKQKYKVKYLPTILIFDGEGNLIDRLEETMSPRKLLNVLEGHNEVNKPNRKYTSVNRSPSKRQNNTTKTVSHDYKVDYSVTKKQYRIQVGTYSDFKKTFKYVNELKSKFAEPIIVLNDYHGENIVYKVMIGEFESAKLADDFKSILSEEFGISGIVK